MGVVGSTVANRWYQVSRGTYKFASGDVYEGERKASKREGRGTYTFANGNVYEGEWKADKMEGRGTYRYANGNVYEGEWKAGQKEGRGTIKYANGKVLVTSFKQGVPVDEGVGWSADGLEAWRLHDGEVVAIISPEEASNSGERMLGVYKGARNESGQMEGRGTFRYTDGKVYEGEYKADQQEGRGTCRYADGDVYEGQYKTGQMEGRGAYRWASGAVYEGQYKAGQMAGRGTYSYANGNVMVTVFKQNVPVGEGVKWSADGLQALRLRDGQVVEAISPEEAQQTAQQLSLPIPEVVASSSTSAQKPSLGPPPTRMQFAKGGGAAGNAAEDAFHKAKADWFLAATGVALYGSPHPDLRFAIVARRYHAYEQEAKRRGTRA